LVSLAISTILEGLSDQLKASFPMLRSYIYILNLIISFIVITSLFAIIFKVLPMQERNGRTFFPGVGIGILFMIGKFAISFYIGKSM
jgi:membrane protein